MAIITNFLCWSNTRTGSAVCGYYSLVISVLCLAFYMVRYIAMDEINGSVELKGIVYAGFILYSLMIGVSLILLPGVYMDRKIFLLPWIYVLVLMVLYETGAIALITTVHLERDKKLTAWEIVAVVFYCARLFANCYGFACVVSQYQELSEGRGTYEYLFKPRWRNGNHRVDAGGDNSDEYNPPYGASLPPYSMHNPYKQFSPPNYENLSLDIDHHDINVIGPAYSPGTYTAYRTYYPSGYAPSCVYDGINLANCGRRGSQRRRLTQEQASSPSVQSCLGDVIVNHSAEDLEDAADDPVVDGEEQLGNLIQLDAKDLSDSGPVILSSNLQGISLCPLPVRHCQTRSDVGLGGSGEEEFGLEVHNLPRSSSSRSLDYLQDHHHHHHRRGRQHQCQPRCSHCGHQNTSFSNSPHPGSNSPSNRDQRRKPPDYEQAVAMTSASGSLKASLDVTALKKSLSTSASPDSARRKAVKPKALPISPLTIQKRTYITWI